MDDAKSEVRVRDEVRACVARATTGMLADIERETDAIMSAFKRGSGVVVKELIDVLDRHVEAEHYTAADALDDLTKARAIAKRITSAVEPSGVVTDEMVKAAARAIIKAAERMPDDLTLDQKAEQFARAALTAALSSRTEEDVRADVIEEIAAEIESPESPTLPANIKQTLFCCAEDPEMEDAYRVMDVIASHVRSLTNGGE